MCDYKKDGTCSENLYTKAPQGEPVYGLTYGAIAWESQSFRLYSSCVHVTVASACVMLLALIKCWTGAHSLLDWCLCVIPTYGKSQHRVARFQHSAGLHGSMHAGLVCPIDFLASAYPAVAT